PRRGLAYTMRPPWPTDTPTSAPSTIDSNWGAPGTGAGDGEADMGPRVYRLVTDTGTRGDRLAASWSLPSYTACRSCSPRPRRRVTRKASHPSPTRRSGARPTSRAPPEHATAPAGAA